MYASYYSHVKTKHEPPKLVCTICHVRFHSYTQLHSHAFKLHQATVTAVAPLTAALPHRATATAVAHRRTLLPPRAVVEVRRNKLEDSWLLNNIV